MLYTALLVGVALLTALLSVSISRHVIKTVSESRREELAMD